MRLDYPILLESLSLTLQAGSAHDMIRGKQLNIINCVCVTSRVELQILLCVFLYNLLAPCIVCQITALVDLRTL